MSLAARFLINERFPKRDLTIRHVQKEVTARIHSQIARSFHAQIDCFRIGSRCDDKVILDCSLVSIEDEVYTRVDIRVLDAVKCWDICSPICTVATKKIIDSTRQRIDSYDLRGPIDIGQMHAYKGGFCFLPHGPSVAKKSRTMGW